MSNDNVKFNSSFALYIDPNENSYLNFVINKKDNLNILKETSNKFLIERKEYKLNSSSILMVKLVENFDTKVNIYKEGKIISNVTKKNPYAKIDEPNKDLIFISDKNALINFYYNIKDLFFEEVINIISYPKDKSGVIMMVKILQSESKPYYYAINYWYDNFIPPDTKKFQKLKLTFI